MKNFIKTFMLALAVAAGAASCSDKDVESSVVEGLPVSLNLTINLPQDDEVAVTRATEEAEKKVEKVALFFYRKSFPQNAPVVYEFSSAGLTQSGNSVTLTLTTGDAGADNALCSGNWYLYAIANYDKKFCTVDIDDLKKKTKAEMDEYVTGGSADQDFVETSVLMSGKYGSNGGLLTLQPGGNNTLSETIKLRRLVAKSTFTFTGGTGVTFTPVSYEVHQYSTSSTLMERDGWANYDPGTLTHKGADGGIEASTASLPIDGTSFYFYTQENAHLSNTQVTSYNMREAHNGVAAEQTYKYAPDGSTYVVVKGLYSGPISQTDNTQVTANVSYTIHLGDFSTATGSWGNYSVRRNTKYTYNVTVNGVNSIVVEAGAEDETKEGIQPGVEGVVTQNKGFNDTIDAHYEQILLELSIPNGFDNYSLRISTPKGTETMTISDSPTKDYEWVKFGRPASTSTFQAYGKVKANLCDIKTLLSELKGNLSESTNNHYMYSGGKVYVAAYVDEYYYSDLALDKFVNADDREMTLAEVISTSGDGKSVYTRNALFSIKQRSIKSPFSLTLSNPYGLETVDEMGATEITFGSQLGSSGNSADDGLSNTRNALSGTRYWSTYIDESINGWRKVDGKYVRSNAVQSSTSNAYTKFGFLTRNRDEDGDGYIDQDEIKWYVPAVNQCLYLWIGLDALPVQTVDVVKKIKEKSRASTKQEWNYLTSTYDRCTWWSAEGTAFGGTVSNAKHLCVVRNLGKNTNSTATSAIASYNSSDRTITVDGLSPTCYRTSMMTGEYVEHSVGGTPDKVYKKFKVYGSTVGSSLTNDQVKSTYVVSDNISADDKAYWRIPNEKEFALMYILGANSTAMTAARTYYKGNSSTVFYIDGGNITTNAKTDGFSVLPVRDVE